MRVLCDVHLPYRLVARLRELGIEATHVNRILEGSRTTDTAISAYVDANEMLLISKDGDFRDKHFIQGTPARILRITLGNLPNTELIAIVEQRWPDIAALYSQGPFYAELSPDGLLRFPEGH